MPSNIITTEKNLSKTNCKYIMGKPSPITAYIKSMYPNIKLYVGETPDYIYIHNIEVPAEDRRKGIGSDVIQTIKNYAVTKKKPVVLEPAHPKGDKTKLLKFYKRLGFVHNEGKKFDPKLTLPYAKTMYWKSSLFENQFLSFKLWLEIWHKDQEITIGININDSIQPFTEQILDGNKTIETRNNPTLNPYVNQKVGIIRTGQGQAKLVGFFTIGRPKFYKNKKEFDKDYDKHLVGKDSPYYITDEGKWGYPLLNVEKTEETPVFSKGIVSRKI